VSPILKRVNVTASRNQTKEFCPSERLGCTGPHFHPSRRHVAEHKGRERERHFELQEFMTGAYAGQETIDSKLNDLVTYRNEAARNLLSGMSHA
jgi:hypothetical protein